MATIDQRIKRLEGAQIDPQERVFVYFGDLESDETQQRLNDFEIERLGKPGFFIQIVGVGND